MAARRVVAFSSDYNGLIRPNAEAAPIDTAGEYRLGSNEKTLWAKENPGALAGATGTAYQDWLSWIDHNLNRESAARALARAVAECDPADRVPFLETLIEGLCQGGPLPAFGGVMAAARDWASWASRVELKAYTLAAFEAMNGPDQAAFLGLVDRRAAA